MEFSTKFDKLSQDDPLYILRGSQVIISKAYCISFSEDQFCLCQSTHLGVSSLKRVESYFAVVQWINHLPFKTRYCGFDPPLHRSIG